VRGGGGQENVECLANWRVRIREPRTPPELLQIAEELQLRSEAARSDLLRRAEEGQPDTSPRSKPTRGAGRLRRVDAPERRRSWGTLDESYKCGTSR
jgi:hypothetical protein